MVTGAFTGLNLSLRALYSSRKAMNVTSENVANANTEGHTRKVASFKTFGENAAGVSEPDSAVKILCEKLFDGCFDYNLGESAAVARKPARDMVDMSLKALGVSASEAVYVGDSEIDLQTAENAEMPCIAVTWGFRGREFLERHGAKMIIDKPQEMHFN